MQILSVTRNYGFKKNYDGSLYEEVYVACYVDVCELICRGYGSLECKWSVGLSNACARCFNDFYNCNAQEMFDYAQNKIDDGIDSGSYSLNYIDDENNVIYYRTVVWNFDTQENIHKIDLSVTEVEQY
jgi:hypothetical protein